MRAKGLANYPFVELRSALWFESRSPTDSATEDRISGCDDYAYRLARCSKRIIECSSHLLYELRLRFCVARERFASHRGPCMSLSLPHPPTRACILSWSCIAGPALFFI
jgi:hypothetical protein